MTNTHRSILGFLAPLCIVAAGALLKPPGLPYSTVLAAVGGKQQAPDRVYVGVPFLVTDGYATLLCVSSRAGRPFLPYLAATNTNWSSTVAPVQAGVPFIVHDAKGTQVCVSSRSGQPLPPFIQP